MKKHHFTIPIFTILLGVFLHLIIPAVLAVIIGVFFMVLTIFDPLYAAKRTAYIWEAFFYFVILQGLNAFVSSSVFGILAAVFIEKIKEKQFYLIVIGASLLIHILFLPIFVAGYYFIFKPSIYQETLVVSIFLTLIFAPILGLMVIFLKMRSDKSITPNYFEKS